MQLRQFARGRFKGVGIARGFPTQPGVVFLAEPMPGLDPLGRREMRQLMMRLRDSGCTVFFSSHILGDAESLCSRVAILAGGRLVTTGRLADMLGFELRGWELIVSALPREKLAALGARVARIVPLAHGRVALELPADPPEPLIAELTRHGGRVLSL